jgi:hypothetical protein
MAELPGEDGNALVAEYVERLESAGQADPDTVVAEAISQMLEAGRDDGEVSQALQQALEAEVPPLVTDPDMPEQIVNVLLTEDVYRQRGGAPEPDARARQGGAPGRESEASGSGTRAAGTPSGVGRTAATRSATDSGPLGAATARPSPRTREGAQRVRTTDAFRRFTGSKQVAEPTAPATGRASRATRAGPAAEQVRLTNQDLLGLLRAARVAKQRRQQASTPAVRPVQEHLDGDSPKGPAVDPFAGAHLEPGVLGFVAPEQASPLLAAVDEWRRAGELRSLPARAVAAEPTTQEAPVDQTYYVAVDSPMVLYGQTADTWAFLLADGTQVSGGQFAQLLVEDWRFREALLPGRSVTLLSHTGVPESLAREFRDALPASVAVHFRGVTETSIVGGLAASLGQPAEVPAADATVNPAHGQKMTLEQREATLRLLRTAWADVERGLQAHPDVLDIRPIAVAANRHAQPRLVWRALFRRVRAMTPAGQVTKVQDTWRVGPDDLDDAHQRGDWRVHPVPLSALREMDWERLVQEPGNDERRTAVRRGDTTVQSGVPGELLLGHQRQGTLTGEAHRRLGKLVRYVAEERERRQISGNGTMNGPRLRIVDHDSRKGLSNAPPENWVLPASLMMAGMLSRLGLDPRLVGSLVPAAENGLPLGASRRARITVTEETNGGEDAARAGAAPTTFSPVQFETTGKALDEVAQSHLRAIAREIVQRAARAGNGQVAQLNIVGYGRNQMSGDNRAAVVSNFLTKEVRSRGLHVQAKSGPGPEANFRVGLRVHQVLVTLEFVGQTGPQAQPAPSLAHPAARPEHRTPLDPGQSPGLHVEAPDPAEQPTAEVTGQETPLVEADPSASTRLNDSGRFDNAATLTRTEEPGAKEAVAVPAGPVTERLLDGALAGRESQPVAENPGQGGPLNPGAADAGPQAPSRSASLEDFIREAQVPAGVELSLSIIDRRLAVFREADAAAKASRLVSIVGRLIKQRVGAAAEGLAEGERLVLTAPAANTQAARAIVEWLEKDGLRGQVELKLTEVLPSYDDSVPPSYAGAVGPARAHTATPGSGDNTTASILEADARDLGEDAEDLPAYGDSRSQALAESSPAALTREAPGHQVQGRRAHRPDRGPRVTRGRRRRRAPLARTALDTIPEEGTEEAAPVSEDPSPNSRHDPDPAHQTVLILRDVLDALGADAKVDGVGLLDLLKSELENSAAMDLDEALKSVGKLAELVASAFVRAARESGAPEGAGFMLVAATEDGLAASFIASRVANNLRQTVVLAVDGQLDVNICPD